MSAKGPLLAALVIAGGFPSPAAAQDACETHRARYGKSNLTLVGALALASRHAAPRDEDLRCLEQIWLGRDGGMGEEASRTLLAITSRHALPVVKAAGERPEVYRAWMAEWKAYGIADYTGQAAMARGAIRELQALKPRNARESAGHKILLDGFRAVHVFKVD